MLLPSEHRHSEKDKLMEGSSRQSVVVRTISWEGLGDHSLDSFAMTDDDKRIIALTNAIRPLANIAQVLGNGDPDAVLVKGPEGSVLLTTADAIAAKQAYVEGSLDPVVMGQAFYVDVLRLEDEVKDCHEALTGVGIPVETDGAPLSLLQRIKILGAMGSRT